MLCSERRACCHGNGKVLQFSDSCQAIALAPLHAFP
jgi:hypothetical protein